MMDLTSGSLKSYYALMGAVGFCRGGLSGTSDVGVAASEGDEGLSAAAAAL